MTVDEFIAKWENCSGSERSRYAVFLTQFADLLGVGAPDPSTDYLINAPVPGGSAGGGTGFIDYTKSTVFDPFPFPDASPDQRTRIGDLAEELDVTRKAALAEVSRLTMTEIYNLRERIAAGEELAGPDLDRATAARAFIVHHLHEQIDAAVADAYGWPAELAPAEIVARLVALNVERKAEEAAGNVRWLRPDYQIPRFG